MTSSVELVVTGTVATARHLYPHPPRGRHLSHRSTEGSHEVVLWIVTSSGPVCFSPCSQAPPCKTPAIHMALQDLGTRCQQGAMMVGDILTARKTIPRGGGLSLQGLHETTLLSPSQSFCSSPAHKELTSQSQRQGFLSKPLLSQFILSEWHSADAEAVSSVMPGLSGRAPPCL